MENEYKIKGVIFARNWWQAVKTGLSDADRLAFYDMVFRYAFEGYQTPETRPGVKIAFDMVRPFIDQDIVKYQERCERNRANARGGKRVAASGSESLLVATNTNTSINNNTNTNTNTISLTPEKERFFICGLFFGRGALRPAEELERFWQYYESLGWKNNKGAAITKKSAAARMWNLQTGVTTQALASRVAWSNAMLQCDCTDIRVFDSLVQIRPDNGVLHLVVSDVKEFAKICEGQCIAGLRRYAAAYECQKVIYDPA